MKKVVALAGGVGAARFLRGLAQIVPYKDLVIIGNTGDDFEMYGLHISPDLDTITYTLAGIVDERKGWGLASDTFNLLKMLRKLGFETWFKLGDRDMAIHLARTNMLKDGLSLSEITSLLCAKLGVQTWLIPMTNEQVRTKIGSANAFLDFQTYFVKRGTRDRINEIFFDGSDVAKPAPGVIKAIREADGIVICPSNPFLSIAPILSISGIKEEILSSSAVKVGISPIIGGRAIKGPADKIMVDLGIEASAIGIAKIYADLLDCLLIDTIDEHLKGEIEKIGLKAIVTNTIMKNTIDSTNLARIAINR